uniref:Uncharacterized protein n=1 Tax=Rhizophora mucronata TaxID=61149 RepID=A0A2P2QQK6_RHIMU
MLEIGKYNIAIRRQYYTDLRTLTICMVHKCTPKAECFQLKITHSFFIG